MEQNKMKYKLTEETKVVYGHTLHRVVCVTAFASVSVGDIGGWVESEKNLSQEGNAWVYDDAMVYGDAIVCGNARVYDDARVYGNAEVCGDAEVYDDARVYGDAIVCCNAWVYGNAEVCGDAEVCGNAEVCGDARVYGLTDFMVLKNSWSSGRCFTYTASNKMWKVGCFYGTGEELVKKAYKDSELSGKCYEAAVKYVEEIERLKKELKNEH